MTVPGAGRTPRAGLSLRLPSPLLGLLGQPSVLACGAAGGAQSRPLEAQTRWMVGLTPSAVGPCSGCSRFHSSSAGRPFPLTSHAPHRSTSWDPKDGPGGRTWEKHLGDF